MTAIDRVALINGTLGRVYLAAWAVIAFAGMLIWGMTGDPAALLLALLPLIPTLVFGLVLMPCLWLLSRLDRVPTSETGISATSGSPDPQ